VVLATFKGRPRLAWLLPPHHVALLPRARILPTLEAVLAAEPELCQESAGVAFVSGPSRSADIELTLTRGVHGPRDLDVVVLP
jgi:L-lactate dehydrogenase complex protein LldG